MQFDSLARRVWVFRRRRTLLANGGILTGMQGALLTLVAVALGAEPQSGLKVAFPGLTGGGVPAERLTFFSEHLDQQMTFAGADTISRSEIGALLGIERQRQLLGCSEDSSACMAELAGALAADALLQGDITLVGTKYRLNLKLLRSSDGQTLAAFSDTVTDETALIAALEKGAGELVETAAQVLGRKVTPTAVKKTSRLRKLSFVPIAVGAAAAIAGVVFFVRAKLAYDALLPSTPISTDMGARLRRDGETSQLLAWVFAGAGAAVLATGVVLFMLGQDTSVSTSVAPVPGGAAVTIGGSFF